jgi:hypothetical protein
MSFFSKFELNISEEHGANVGLFLTSVLLAMSGFRLLGRIRNDPPKETKGSKTSCIEDVKATVIAVTDKVVTEISSASLPDRGAEVRAHWATKEGEHDDLKEVLSDSALEWVKDRNAHCVAQLGDPNRSPLYNKVLSILDSNDKIPYLRKINDLYYNFWQDKQNPRGLWRRITMESYMSAHPQWETVLDFDELGRMEGESWVYKVR